MDDRDYDAIRELATSPGWEILCKELDDRIKAIENILLEPNLDRILNTDDLEKQMRLINHKKEERIYLINLKNLPKELLATKIKLTK